MQLKNIHVSGKFQIGKRGKYVFTAKGKEQNYRSRVYEDPTIADLIEAADESVDVTNDRRHIFLEDYSVTHGNGDAGEIEIHFGS